MIGERLKEIASIKGLKIGDIAAACGVSRQTLHAWAVADSVTVSTLEKLGAALGVPSWELLRPAGSPVLSPDGINPAPVVLSGVVSCPHCGQRLRVDLRPEE